MKRQFFIFLMVISRSAALKVLIYVYYLYFLGYRSRIESMSYGKLATIDAAAITMIALTYFASFKIFLRTEYSKYIRKLSTILIVSSIIGIFCFFSPPEDVSVWIFWILLKNGIFIMGPVLFLMFFICLFLLLSLAIFVELGSQIVLLHKSMEWVRSFSIVSAVFLSQMGIGILTYLAAFRFA